MVSTQDLQASSSLRSQRQVEKPGKTKEGLWERGWLSMEQRRQQVTPQHTQVLMGKTSREWGQALPSTDWWEGKRWHLLKLERLDKRNETKNPYQAHEALNWVAQKEGAISLPAGLQDLSNYSGYKSTTVRSPWRETIAHDKCSRSSRRHNLFQKL